MLQEVKFKYRVGFANNFGKMKIKGVVYVLFVQCKVDHTGKKYYRYPPTTETGIL